MASLPPSRVTDSTPPPALIGRLPRPLSPCVSSASEGSVCLSVFGQEADADDRLAEGECDVDSKADTPDVPPSTADTDNTPQYLNKALEGLPPR